MSMYKSKKWKKKRKKILERDNYECQKCKVEGRYSKADAVHHKKHLSGYPVLAFDDNNLISLCNKCHNEEHPEKLKKYQAGQKEYITRERW